MSMKRASRFAETRSAPRSLMLRPAGVSDARCRRRRCCRGPIRSSTESSARPTRTRRRTRFRSIKAPAGAPNVLLIMIDDSGFGQWGTFGGQVPDAQSRRARPGGDQLHPVSHDRALLADPGGVADRAQPPFGGHRRHHGTGQRLSRLQRPDPEERGDGRGNPAPERLQHRLLRQEPQHSRLGDQHFRPVRPLARHCRASTISTGSSAARRTSGSRRSTTAPSRSKWKCRRAARPTTR